VPDAATPTFRSEVVARSLPRAALVVFPAGTQPVPGLCCGRLVQRAEAAVTA
jgi:hypothetical protein